MVFTGTNFPVKIHKYVPNIRVSDFKDELTQQV